MITQNILALKMEKKILVAIDGSVYSSNSLDYLIRLFAGTPDISMELLSIISMSATDQNWMFDVDPLRSTTPAVERRTASAKRYLRDAKERLLRNGFKSEQVTYTTKISSISIAKTLHQYANEKLFDAVLIGRRGMGMVGEMFFGSVSAELIEKCHDTPLWIIDGEVISARFLLAVHFMPQSLLAADHLAYITNSNHNIRINLYHSDPIFGSKPSNDPKQFHQKWDKSWCDKNLDFDNYLFGAHTVVLTEGKILPDQIKQLKVHKNLDASHDLLRQAKLHGCGTIVIGRRGANTPKGLLGGVSDRTMKNAENIAVWLVG